MSDISNLTQADIELLYESRRMDDAVLLERRAVSTAREALAWAVAEGRSIDLESAQQLPLDVLARQIETDLEEDDGANVLSTLADAAQMPETTRADDSAADDGDDAHGPTNPPQEALEALSSAQRMEDRTPKFAEEQRERAADLCGVDDWQEIEFDESDLEVV
ncbi:hypothetical protein [Natronorubrum sp. A-ect3]|uniref:hypothetical protein n=1 Tax=Natronorubrum sp. A-ect3 TaxID=3242698 RepID=UPI00359E7416